MICVKLTIIGITGNVDKTLLKDVLFKYLYVDNQLWYWVVWPVIFIYRLYII